MQDWSDVQELNGSKLEREKNTLGDVRKNYPPNPSKNIKLPFVKNNFESRIDGRKCDIQKYSVQSEVTNVKCITKSFAEDSTLPSSSHKVDHFIYSRENMPNNYNALSCKRKHTEETTQGYNSKFQNKREPPGKNISSRHHETLNTRVNFKESDQTNPEALQSYPKKLCTRNDTSFDCDLSNKLIEKPKPVLQLHSLNVKPNQNRQIGKSSYTDGKFNVDAIYTKFAAAENIDDIYDLEI